MKIKFLLQFVLLSILMISCSRDEDSQVMPDNGPLVTKMAVRVLYPEARPSYQEAMAMMFYFSYDTNQRLTKKVGTYLSTSSPAESFIHFTDLVHTSLIYTGNKVTVEHFSTSPDFEVQKESKYFTLNEQNQIETKENPFLYGSVRKKDYYYYKNGRLDEIITRYLGLVYDPTDPDDYVLTFSEKFYYNSNGNLERTEYFEQINGVNSPNPRVRYFLNYDNSYNPFKKFTLLDEYFYRSLSKNNFRNYREENGGSVVSQRTWTFMYDSKGNMIIDKNN